MLDPMPRCKDCAWWNASELLRANAFGRAPCDVLVTRADDEQATVVHLLTPPTFGCTMWKARVS